MAERLFGIETEYALGAARGDQPRALAALMARARRELPHLADDFIDGLFLANGARFYVDRGGHPELTTPECDDPWDVVRYVRAGEAILLRLADDSAFYRCNVDYSGARTTWASHESFMHRADLRSLPRQIIPHFVSRIVYAGAGGFRNMSPGLTFTLSPRAAHLETAVSANSTSNRGIFHEKNEPLCGNGWSRLHVLCGESLCSELGTWLRVGTTALVVALCEAGLRPGATVNLAAPVDALRGFAADPTCRAVAKTRDGRELTAVAIQRAYLAAAEAHASADFMPPWAPEVCRRWRAVLDDLEAGGEAAATSLDWAIKQRLYTEHVRRRGFTWETVEAWTGVAERLSDAMAFVRQDDWTLTPDVVLDRTGPIAGTVKKLTPKLRALGLAWDGWSRFLALRNELFEIDMRFGQLGAPGVFTSLDASGLLTHRVVGADDVARAIDAPPRVPRARIRGQLVRELSSTPDKSRYLCTWDGVWDSKNETCVDLSDPLAATLEWRDWQDDFGVAVPGRVRSGRASGSGRRRPPPRDPLAMNQAALECRRRGDLEQAEALLREAVALEDTLVPSDSPKRPHRRNNLALVLMRAAKLEEALAWNAEAWALKAEQHDVTSGRILFVRAALTLLRGQTDLDVPLGQMKTLLGNGALPSLGDVATIWDIPDVLLMLVDALPASSGRLFVALAEALNARAILPALDGHKAWRRAAPVALDAAWPAV